MSKAKPEGWRYRLANNDLDALDAQAAVARIEKLEAPVSGPGDARVVKAIAALANLDEPVQINAGQMAVALAAALEEDS